MRVPAIATDSPSQVRKFLTDLFSSARFGTQRTVGFLSLQAVLSACNVPLLSRCAHTGQPGNDAISSLCIVWVTPRKVRKGATGPAPSPAGSRFIPLHYKKRGSGDSRTAEDGRSARGFFTPRRHCSRCGSIVRVSSRGKDSRGLRHADGMHRQAPLRVDRAATGHLILSTRQVAHPVPLGACDSPSRL